MNILPAVEIVRGKVVHRQKGSLQRVRHYSGEPALIAQGLKALGYNWVHLVHLWGASLDSAQVKKKIQDVVSTGMKVQLGAKIYDVKTAREYLDMGVSRVLFGSHTAADPKFMDELMRVCQLDSFGVSLDVRDRILVCPGSWIHRQSFESTMFRMKSQGVKHVVVKDLARDSASYGVDTALYHMLTYNFPKFKLCAAGGIASHYDLVQLERQGLAEAIVGRAFYEKKLKLILC